MPLVIRKPIPVAQTVELIPMSSLTRREQLQLDNAVSHYGNPADVFDRKVAHLARLLDCTESEATAVLLHNL